jgi:putative ABC transport system substrate-binding protein
MKRREFIAGLGSAATWPLAARAQQGDRGRRVGVLLVGAENDPTIQTNLAAFRDGLAKLGWVGGNLRIEVRFGSADSDRIRAHATELVSLAPEVIVAAGGAPTRALQQQTRTIPIVTSGGDILANGIVKNIARPEGNITGFPTLYSSIAGKWLELLKEAAPRVGRVAVIYNPQLASDGGAPFLLPIEEAARALAVNVIKLPFRDAVDIVHGIDSFAADPNGGLIVLPPPPVPGALSTILRLAALHRLPTIYNERSYAAAGGLMTYGANGADRYRRASYFVDRILRGAKVSELPVEFPTKFELVINLKTAKAMGLTIPESFLLRADEVIE